MGEPSDQVEVVNDAGHGRPALAASGAKRLKSAIVVLWAILSIALLPIVDIQLHPVSVLSEIGYEPWISKYFGWNDFSRGWGFYLSAILLPVLTLMLRRAYSSRSKRVLFLAPPLLAALFIHFLILLEIDLVPHRGRYLGFAMYVLISLPGFVLYRVMIVGLILFVLILITCYPIGVLADYLLIRLGSWRKARPSQTT